MNREQLAVRNGYEYDHYFPKAMGAFITQKKGATVTDTIRFIPQVVNDTLSQTKRFADEIIKAPTLYETCKNIWDFVFNHIKYRKDEEDKEQVRSPARSWRDRQVGVDCDCYTVFISSILTNLNIKHVLRITKYGAPHFQHIYPIVPIGNGRYITIDCVVLKFNEEEPYTEKKDTTMDLEYLNGVSVSDRSKHENEISNEAFGALSDREAMTELGKLFRRKASGEDSSEEGGKKKGRFKKFIGKGFHALNRFSLPALAIRAGILAAMKLNFMKIASELKYTYLSAEEALKKGVLMDKFPRMKKIREKLEKMFFVTGGKPKNLRLAILKGKGNKHKDVPLAGIDYVSSEHIEGLHEDMPLSQLLGADIYTSENMHEINGFTSTSLSTSGELGEPATAATIAAASTVLTTIVALIKKVGSLIPKKKPTGDDNSSSHDNGGGGGASESDTYSQHSGSDENQQQDAKHEQGHTVEAPAETSTSTKENLPAVTNEKEEADAEEKNSASTQRKSSANNTQPVTKPPSFWEKNKKWITPTGIAVGAVTAIAFVYHALKPKTEVAIKTKDPINGIPEKIKKNTPHHTLHHTTKKKKGGHTTHHTSKIPKKEIVTLM